MSSWAQASTRSNPNSTRSGSMPSLTNGAESASSESSSVPSRSKIGTSNSYESRGVVADERLDRPRNSPLTASSSHRAPHVRHAHESTRIDARYKRSTSNEPQYGHWKCSTSSPKP